MNGRSRLPEKDGYDRGEDTASLGGNGDGFSGSSQPHAVKISIWWVISKSLFSLHNSGNYGSKSVPSDFENKNPLNCIHSIFMHWNNVSNFFASEFNSLQFQYIIFTFIFQCKKIQNQNSKFKTKYFQLPKSKKIKLGKLNKIKVAFLLHHIFRWCNHQVHQQ